MSDDWIDNLNDKLTGSNKVEMDGWLGHMQDGYFIPDEPINPGKSSGDWRIDRVDQIIQDNYDEAIWWHNSRISEGTDPRSGLRNLPYIPWDENIDGVAAMQGAIGGVDEGSYARNGGHWRQNDTRARLRDEDRRRGVTDEGAVAGTALIVIMFVILCGLGCWMAGIPDWFSVR